MSTGQYSDFYPAPSSVLIIDREVSEDSPFMSMLDPFSCVVDIASTVPVFLSRPTGKGYDLVLVEVDVFDPDAIPNAAALRAHFDKQPKSYIVGFSSFAPGEFKRFAEQAGCDECVLTDELPGVCARVLREVTTERMPETLH
jgi:hypothetical protein